VYVLYMLVSKARLHGRMRTIADTRTPGHGSLASRRARPVSTCRPARCQHTVRNIECQRRITYGVKSANQNSQTEHQM